MDAGGKGVGAAVGGTTYDLWATGRTGEQTTTVSVYVLYERREWRDGAEEGGGTRERGQTWFKMPAWCVMARSGGNTARREKQQQQTNREASAISVPANGFPIYFCLSIHL